MNKFILDIKIYIASFDENVWIDMVVYDEEFKQYAYTKTGAYQFANNFHETFCNSTYLFNYLHSINDQPAIIDEDYKYWYSKGDRHRGNNLPACIYADGDQSWWHRGKLHRDVDLPAIITKKGAKHWFHHGKKHRENGLPAFINTNGKKEWWVHGKQVNI